MKICPKCKKTYTDDFSFCNICGCNLNQYKSSNVSNKSVLLTLIIIAIVVVVGGVFVISEQIRMGNTRQAIEDYKDNKALQEYRNTPTKYDIKVNSGWTTEISGNYIYIRGTVTNTSASKTISYFEVEAKFYDKYGSVIDSDWTNDGDDLAPGESRKFEIMHKYSSEEQDITLSIKNVS